jgi:alkyldihydroxyacetonephosphate synthase
MLRNVLRAPGAFNGLIDALGSRVLGGAMLVLVFEGAGEEPLDDLARAARLCEGRSARCLGEGPARHWLEHRYSISYRQSPVFAAGAFSDTMEVAAPWSRLGELYDAVRHALGKHVFVMAHLSHAYPGGCSIYFTFAGSARDDAACEALYDRAWSDALGAAIGSGGTLSHHHGVGRSKAPRLGEELGAGVDVVRCLMRACDPAGILNPGNLVPPGTAARRAPGATNEPAALALDQTSLLARVPGSMTLAAVETSLAAQRVTLDLATDAPRGETVAAWLAKGAPGGPDPWLDPVDHLVAGLAVRLPSGVPLDQRPSPRRAVGPDLASLFVGMFERFGAIRGADLRVRRTDSPRARELANGLDRNPPMTEGESRLLDAMAAGVREIR